jgi:bifunctional pyridoxal-dependent enzyme with beta-cystathionase and maltose regulon repressor activities
MFPNINRTNANRSQHAAAHTEPQDQICYICGNACTRPHIEHVIRILLLYLLTGHLPLNNIVKQASLKYAHKTCNVVVKGSIKLFNVHCNDARLVTLTQIPAAQTELSTKFQNAIQTALGGYQSIDDLVGEGGRLRRQRDLAWELVTKIPGVTCVKPKAALYLFPKLDPEMYPIENDQEFIANLLREEKVLLVQGSGFNWPKPDHFRIVFLPHEDVLREAIARLAKFLERYRQKHGKK